MTAWLAWLEATTAARTVAESAMFTAVLSAAHLLGFTLVTGGALIGNLRLLGSVLVRLPAPAVLGPATRAILLGLAISVGTGGLLFAARATEIGANGTFRLKMTLLVAMAAFYFAVTRRSTAGAADAPARTRVVGAVGLLLSVALAVTACAFILLE